MTSSTTASALTVYVKACTSASGSATLTVLAGNDLKSGSDTITIDNLTWTASGTGFAGGTMSKAFAVTLGIVDCRRPWTPHALGP